MKIRDISDRVYQGQVYALLERARSSIVISMFLIRPGDHPKHPVNRLLQRLVDARPRGVEVTIYLNTKLKSSTPQKIVEGPWFDILREEGIQIRLVSPVRMLHDKLVVVDRRFVVERSMNWSVAAIASNFAPESAGEYLGILRGESRSAVRRQMIRVLRDLQKIDKLLRPEFRHGKEVGVELLIPAGHTFPLSSESLEAGELAEMTDNQVFLRLVRSKLHDEGKRLEDLSWAERRKRFFIDQKTVARTLGSREQGRKPASASL